MTFLYLDSEDNEFGAVAETIVSTLEAAGVGVYMKLTWNTIYHHGYSKSPFDDLVELSFTDTRSEFRISTRKPNFHQMGASF